MIGLDVTRVVAPLREKGPYASFPLLTPEVDFDGRRWIVRVQEPASVTAGELGRTIGRIDGGRGDILRAIDVLTRGFRVGPDPQARFFGATGSKRLRVVRLSKSLT